MALVLDKSPISVLFISHVGQIKEEFAPLARGLSQRFDLQTLLWTLGGGDYKAGLECAGFDQVVDLMAGFDKFAPIPDATSTEHLIKLRKLEQQLGGSFYHQDAALDRSFTGFTDAAMDYRTMKSRWTYQQLAAMSIHLVARVQEELSRSKVVLAIGETNTQSYRLIYRLLKSHGIAELYPNPLPHGDGHMYFDDSLDSAWLNCRRLYSMYSAEGIPDEFRGLAEAKLENICKQRAKPDYYLRARRGARGWRERLSLVRVAHGLREWWEAMNNKGQQTNPRALPPELLSPRARISRAGRVRHRRKFYEKVAQHDIPKQRYACYFLHMQPEYTVEALAFEYQDQVALARNIIASLPADIILLVKEHKGDAGRRSASFYGELVSIPNVILIHDTVDSLELIQQASFVITLTGTVALESICLGVPCIIFGDNYYEHFKGIYKAHSFTGLKEILAEPGQLRGASRQEALVALAARYAASYRAEYPGRLGDQNNVQELVNAVEQECRRRNVRLFPRQVEG